MLRLIFIIKRNEHNSININPYRGTSKAADAGSNKRSKNTKTMSEDYKLPADDEETVLYLVPEIGKQTEHLNLKSLLYVRHVLDKVANEYNINPDQSIGMVGDRKSVEVIMAELIEGYQKYWGDNFASLADDIDFDNPLPNKV